MKIYTKTGDRGETSLGNGTRVKKSDPRIWLVGEIDELNSLLGVASSFIKDKETSKILENIQRDLFVIGAVIARSVATKQSHRKNVEIAASVTSFLPRNDVKKRVLGFEKIIDSLDKELPLLRNFILPGGTQGASFLHLARSVCRRVERRLVELGGEDPTSLKLRGASGILIYLNRLSDLLFTLARNENRLKKTKEIIWKK